MTETANPGKNANYYDSADPNGQHWLLGKPYYRTEVGEFEQSASAYGALDMTGNASEWTDTVSLTYPNPPSTSWRALRGGSFGSEADYLQASYRTLSYGEYTWGFRVAAAVPEPSTLALLGMGLFGLLTYAWRKRK